ncbi:MAG: hypothetical protein KDC73_05095 [Ignavibacteriae bacterium]|nr:hypothetical protein [Ignavibacteriota bacterium]MCB9243901.1 hypothetical protein [Ignavibacteriales bacterium]
MKDLIKQLEAIGFTNYESKVFMVLMQGHNMTAAEIAKEAKIPRTSVYDILKSFAQKGICNEIETPSKLRYEMIDPDIVEDKLKNGFKKSFENQLNELDSSFKTLKSFYKSKAQKDSSEKIELLKGFNKHRHLKFLELMKKTKRQLLIANKIPDRISTDVDKVVDKFLEKGGKIKTLYQLGGSVKIKFDDGWREINKEKLIELLKTFETDKVEIKLTHSLPQSFFVFDENYVFLNIVDESLEQYNMSDLIIDNEKYATAMKDLFDYYWDRSMTIGEYEKS